MTKKGKLYYTAIESLTARRLDKKPYSWNFIMSNWQTILDAHKTANKVSKSEYNVPGTVTLNPIQFKDFCKDLGIRENTKMINLYYNSTRFWLVKIVKDTKKKEDDKEETTAQTDGKEKT